MIIAVDYDGTLWDGKAINYRLIKRLQREQRCGNTIILWTCRERDGLASAITRLAGAGFHPNYINRNAPEAIAKLGHDSRKIFADVYIDDKGMPAW